MKAFSSADKSNVISLLLSCHSIRKVESITGLGKSTVGRIYQELEMNKENYKGGRPSKLSPTDQRRIVNQIITGKLDNAFQATNYINTIIHKPVCPQTVRNALKRNHLKAVVKAKKSLLKARHRQRRLVFTLYHQKWTIEDWKSQMRPRLTGLGNNMCEKRRVNQYQTGQHSSQWSMEEVWWYGAVWAGMG